LYKEPGRYYHTIKHVADCLSKLDTLDDMDGLIDRRVAEVALIWHDAVYVPGSNENEVISARLLDAVSETFEERRLGANAHAAILATQHREGYAGVYGNRTVDAVVDIDLSILGEPSEIYDHYVSDIRREYRHVSDEVWCAGRGSFLRGMIQRTDLYSLPEMRERFDSKARENMQAELARL
jgi:predicted metal-dependent HD superfamily phosphohydrolase